MLLMMVFGLFAAKSTAQLMPYAEQKTSAPPRIVTSRFQQALLDDDPLHPLYTFQVNSWRAWLDFQHKYPKSIRGTGSYPAAGLVTVRIVQPGLLEELLRQPWIVYADQRSEQPQTEAALQVYDFTINQILQARAAYPKLTGAGIPIAIREYTFDTSDIDFRGRFRLNPLQSALINSHATNMATTIGGGENTYYSSRGVAPAATLFATDFTPLLPDPDSFFVNRQIHVQNHSYGVGIENFYGAEALAFDQQAYTLPTLLHIFSSGNSGTGTSAVGPYASVPGFANLTGTFKMAKNLITVGALDSVGAVAALSSRGPAYDGRVKPELVAWGPLGSSGAAALTSGVAVLLQQAYRDQHAGQMPSSALLRAILFASADPVSASPISFVSGYGALNSYQAITVLEEQQFQEGTLQEDRPYWSFPLEIPANTAQLRLALSWTDPPAALQASRALVNDLQLEIQDPNGETWLPWTLHTFPHPDSLILPPYRGQDSLNNAALITLNDPPPGTYFVRVYTESNLVNTQPFAIAYQHPRRDTFAWTGPASTMAIPANEPFTLRWTSTLPKDSQGDLAYAYVGSSSLDWIPLAQALAAERGYYTWTPPDTLAQVILRFQTQEQEYLSASLTLTPSRRLEVGYNCPNESLVFWSPIPGAVNYRVYTLGEQYLRLLTTTSDTLLLLNESEQAVPFLAVAPILANGAEGLKTYTYNYQNQGVTCYLRSFFGIAIEEGVELEVNLGTTFQLKEVIIEKWDGSQFNPIETLAPIATQLVTLDESPADGPNTYRPRLRLASGASIIGDTITVYTLRRQSFMAFPNPLPAGEALAFLNRLKEAGTLVFYDALGREVWRYPIVSETEFFRLPPDLGPGVYTFQLFPENGPPTARGQLVVR